MPNPKEMDIAYFVHLHLNTTERSSAHPYKDEESLYCVAGKPRPMLVLTVHSDRLGVRWFRVVPITSKGTDSNQRKKLNLYPIGKLPGDKRDSYIMADGSGKLPQNMVHRVSGRSPVIDTMDPLGFSSLVKIVNHHMMAAN